MTTTIATVADIHHGPKASGHGSSFKATDEALPRTRALVAHVNDLKAVDHTLNLGDLIEHAGTDAAADRNAMIAGLNVLGSLKTPCHHVAGNHDLMNLSEAVVAELFKREALHFSTDLGDHHLIVLHSRAGQRDGSQISVDSAQLKWLEQELIRTEKPTIVAVHHPLSDQDLSNNRWFAEHPQCALIQNRDEIRSLLQRHGNVIAVLNGHTHCNSLELHDGIPYVTQNSLVERIGTQGLVANTHGLVTLKDAQFGMEIFGNDSTISSHEEIARRLGDTYDSIAQSYRENTAAYGQAECNEFDRLAAMRGKRSNLCVVDYGCGPARDANHFMGWGYNYVGVDASREFIRHGRAAYPTAQFHHGDFATLRLTPNSADIAWHSSSLQHVRRDTLPQVLEQAYNTLKPGGLFYAHYRSGEGDSIQISGEYGRPIARPISLYGEAEMQAALRQAGFEIVRSWTFDHQYPGLKGTTVKYKSKVIARKPESGAAL